MRWLIALALMLLASPSRAELRIVDGDSINMDGIHYRLHGIDAPESRQGCPDGWPAGQLATAYLRSLVEGKTVRCDVRTIDRYKRMVAVCSADGWDLGADMVEAGMALAYTRYSLDYLSQQAEAHQRKAGMHAHDCQEPWKWRQHHDKP